MALYNTNSAPSPFGSSSATPQPDIGAQFFLGCTVIDFTVSADWESQGGQLSVNLLEDTYQDYPDFKFEYAGTKQLRVTAPDGTTKIIAMDRIGTGNATSRSQIQAFIAKHANTKQ